MICGPSRRLSALLASSSLSEWDRRTPLLIALREMLGAPGAEELVEATSDSDALGETAPQSYLQIKDELLARFGGAVGGTIRAVGHLGILNEFFSECKPGQGCLAENQCLA